MDLIPKTIIKPAEASNPALPQPVVQEQPRLPKFRFVKTMAVAEELVFEDGSTFRFPLVKRNDGSGYADSSTVETDDPVLAKNLRVKAYAKVHSVHELN